MPRPLLLLLFLGELLLLWELLLFLLDQLGQGPLDMSVDPGNPPLFLSLTPERVSLVLAVLLGGRVQAALGLCAPLTGHIRGGDGWPAGEVEALPPLARLEDHPSAAAKYISCFPSV